MSVLVWTLKDVGLVEYLQYLVILKAEFVWTKESEFKNKEIWGMF